MSYRKTLMRNYMVKGVLDQVRKFVRLPETCQSAKEVILEYIDQHPKYRMAEPADVIGQLMDDSKTYKKRHKQLLDLRECMSRNILSEDEEEDGEEDEEEEKPVTRKIVTKRKVVQTSHVESEEKPKVVKKVPKKAEVPAPKKKAVAPPPPADPEPEEKEEEPDQLTVLQARVAELEGLLAEKDERIQKLEAKDKPDEDSE
jgi:hypothetical protein